MMGGDMLAGNASHDTLVRLGTETGKMAAYLSGHLGRYLEHAQASHSPDSEAPLLDALARGVLAETIDQSQAVGIAIVLFGAGGESTAALLGSALRLLAENPRIQAMLRSDPSLIARFVEEVVRLEPPFKFHYRVVRHRCQLAGFDLEEGDRLLLVWAAANRDAAMIEDPDALRLDRRFPKQHMGFGRGGHFCIGATLARLEARILIEELLLRSDSIEMGEADSFAYAQSIFVRRLERLELRLSPTAASSVT